MASCDSNSQNMKIENLSQFLNWNDVSLTESSRDISKAQSSRNTLNKYDYEI